MADDTQGKAQQKVVTAGENRAAIDRGAEVADARERASVQANRRAAASVADKAPADKRPTAEQIAKREPKMYRALDRGYIDGKIVEPGEVFSTRMDQGQWMEKVKKGQDYGVAMAVEEAQMAKKVDVVYEDLSDAALEVFAAMEGVSKPGELSRDEKIEAIRAARRVDAQ